MTQQAPPDFNAPSNDPNYNLAIGGLNQMGLGGTQQQLEQFLSEEIAAEEARGQKNMFSGWKLPTGMANPDFWQLYSMAETFASSTGWKHLLSPTQLVAGLRLGLLQQSPLDVYRWMAQQTGVDPNIMPWAFTGQTRQQWEQASGNLNDTVMELTGAKGWNDAGLDPKLAATALSQGWSAQRVKDLILKTPELTQKYGYLKYFGGYQEFQSYKTQNANELRQRYGTTFSDTQAIANVAAPQTQFHAQGGGFGQFQPAAQQGQQMPTGHSSSIR